MDTIRTRIAQAIQAEDRIAQEYAARAAVAVAAEKLMAEKDPSAIGMRETLEFADGLLAQVQTFLASRAKVERRGLSWATDRKLEADFLTDLSSTIASALPGGNARRLKEWLNGAVKLYTANAAPNRPAPTKGLGAQR